MKIAARMRALSAEIDRLQTEVRILDEQIAFQSDVAEDARIRALVSETPLADRESKEAGDDLARLMRVRTETLQAIEGLRREQDDLLEQMVDPTGQGSA